MKFIVLAPQFCPKIWGGQRLKEYGFRLPDDHHKYGEALLISDLASHETPIITPEHKYSSFHQWFLQHKHQLGLPHAVRYPLLSKIITASEALSVQVHPDQEDASNHEQDNGKPECWYFLHSEPHSQFVLGTKSKTKTELQASIKRRAWRDILLEQQSVPGGFVKIPTGRIHALGAGNDVFELQTTSDITYRVYDYDRRDQHGNYRPLHQTDFLRVVKVPDKGSINCQILPAEQQLLWKNNFFTLHVVDTTTSALTKKEIKFSAHKWKFIQINVIKGELILNHEHKFQTGTSLICYEVTSTLLVQGSFLAFFSTSQFQPTH